jgi:hypothetical protein
MRRWLTMRRGDGKGRRQQRTTVFDDCEWAPVAVDILEEILQYEDDEGEVRGNTIRPKCDWRRHSSMEAAVAALRAKN